jgi:hypothetical protein
MTGPDAHFVEHDLKKQSQFPTGQMNVNSFHTRDYGNNSALRLRVNKAKQSRFQTGWLVIGRMCRENLIFQARFAGCGEEGSFCKTFFLTDLRQLRTILMLHKVTEEWWWKARGIAIRAFPLQIAGCFQSSRACRHSRERAYMGVHVRIIWPYDLKRIARQDFVNFSP